MVINGRQTGESIASPLNTDESENILIPISLDALEIMSFQVVWSTSPGGNQNF